MLDSWKLPNVKTEYVTYKVDVPSTYNDSQAKEFVKSVSEALAVVVNDAKLAIDLKGISQ